ncbi:AAA domain-containing protein [Desulfobacterales bacterium HSG17]|nr:AAA domain-containing protein [Desulfobacterales bacterium HSG17]
MQSFNLSPSRIARYFYHECERYLRYHSTPSDSRDSEGIPEIEWDTSPVTAAILEGGYSWEQNVIKQILKKKAKIAPGKGELYERAHSIKNSLKVLKNLKLNEAVYQPTLQVPKSFYERYGLDKKLCVFPPCRPDLIQLVMDSDNKLCLRIIDIKASKALKASHRIQVTLYALILREIIKEQDLNLSLDLDMGGVWLYEQKIPEWFELRFSTGAVEQFLSHKLNDILKLPAQEIPWHLFYRCEWCEFYQSCRTEAENTNCVSLVPNLTVGGRRYLRQPLIKGKDPVNSVDDLKTLLEQKSADKLLDVCGSLRGRKDRLLNSVRALQNGKVIAHGGSTLGLPVYENVSIVITLQEDPVSGRIYTLGFRRLKGKIVYGNGSREEIFVAKTPDDCAEIQFEFLESLFEELKVLDKYNRNLPWKEQQSMQAYVFDSYELDLFNRFLQESAKDAGLAPMALQMLFYFQDPALADEDEHPAQEVPFPVIVLTRVIRDLLAMPIPVSLRLPEVLEMLPSPTFKYKFTPRNLFWFDLSNTLKSDAIFNVWTKKDDEQVDQLEQLKWINDEIRKRLIAAHTIVDGLRDKVKDKLFAWPAKFFFPGILDFQNNELSRLAFILRYESFMGAVNMREARTAPWPERVRDAASLPLRLEGGNRWKALSDIDSGLIDDTGGFLNYLLVPDGQTGERAQMSYDDFRYRDKMYGPKGDVRLAGISALEADENSGLIKHFSLKIRSNKDHKPFEKKDEAVLHQRFTDFTSGKMINRLGELDIRPHNDFLSLVQDPCGFAAKKKKSGKAAIDIAEKFAGFTKSQSFAFSQCMEKCLTLIWGPPGTGKTHFLAKAVLCLARTRKQENRQMKIAITAFTHAAIENLLEEIRENARAFSLAKGMPLYKLKYTSTPRGENLETLGENLLHFEMGEDILIVGGTVYSFNKAGVDNQFPILIVDEASQMKFGELALGMKPLAKGGTLILAGDDLQLPPIVQGKYPEPEDGLPGLHESVFAYLRARDSEDKPFTFQLKENWRMNATLSAFPAMTLYGKGYKPVNPEIKKQKISLKPVLKSRNKKSKSPATDLCNWLLDPQWPLAVAILEDIQAAVENPVEAELVAMLSENLRKNLIRPGMKSIFPDNEAGDKDFWQKGLFIVSPHRVQIRAIRKALAKKRKWHTSPFVDTVDKMQGQQCENVIVSYGVSDAETALAEAEFIYSLNRLNVSITRARSKCIVFLPRPLLEPSFDLLQNEKAIKGLGHMHSLIDFCRNFGQEKEFDLDFLNSSGSLRVIRAKKNKG